MYDKSITKKRNPVAIKATLVFSAFFKEVSVFIYYVLNVF